jgi:hypothetical protein
MAERPVADAAYRSGGGGRCSTDREGDAMVTGTTPATGERAEFVVFDGGRPPRWRGRRRWVMVAVVVLAAGAVVVIRGVFDSGGGGGGSSDSGSSTALATVTRGSLSRQMQVNGTLGYAGSYTVLGQTPGRVTWLPAVGQVIGQGQVLYQVDEAPVVLLYGSTPAWRALAEGASTADVTGADVAQLNHDLVALGYVHSADVDSAWDQFNWATRAGVEKLQKHLGVVERTGTLDLGEVVFLPTAARVTTLQASLGAPATGPVLRASSTTRTVSVTLDVDLQSEAKAGDQVTITLPDGATTPGTVTSVGRVATAPSRDSGGVGGSAATVPVTIRPTDSAATGSWDQAPVLVAITTTTVQDALAVPVTALLAQAGGGYAVEVANGDGTRYLVPVSPGLFDDTTGLVQVTGPGLAVGQHVVVPAS